jgi:hypothetical protein
LPGARTVERIAADEVRAKATLWLPQRATGELIPILGDVEIPGESSARRANRLAKEANARADEAWYTKLATGDAKTASDLLNAVAGGIEDATQSYVTTPAAGGAS